MKVRKVWGLLTHGGVLLRKVAAAFVIQKWYLKIYGTYTMSRGCKSGCHNALELKIGRSIQLY